MTDIRERLLAAFDLEHKDHLAAIREALRAADEGRGAGIDMVEIHRRAHSLKGAARAVDLPEVEALAHRLESVFTAVQKGALPFDARVHVPVRRALDAIEDSVAWATRGGPPVDSVDILADLARLTGDEAAPAPALPPAAEPAPRPTATVRTLVRIRAEGLERLLDTAAALLPEVEGQDRVADELRVLRREWAGMAQAWQRLRRGLDRGLDNGGGRDAHFTAALTTFERRMRAAGAALDAAHRHHDRGLWALRRWGGALHEDVRRLRMVPAETQFGGLGRMIRDLGRGQGKDIEADIRGLEVEADRAVLQRLKDPVMHLARNAVNHGIETPEQRIAAGKPPGGRILVEASVAGGRLRLRIEDDGRGLDLAAIRRRAADGTPDDRLLDLVFEPGFSTAETVTEIAGRGMGLSIARREVIGLQGQLTLSPRPEGGTVILIEVPLSLSGQRLVFVEAGGQVMALPAADVVRLHRADAAALGSLEGRPVVRIDGEDVLVSSLAALLGLQPPAGVREHVQLAVVRSGERRTALAVDALVATRDAVVASAEEAGLDPARFIGTVLLDDGSPALVLNAASLGAAEPVALPAVAAARPAVKPCILVVDDSITTRTLEKSILEAHGYHVVLCVDGREALERLGTLKVDLVVSDVEMPRMDGFALVQAVKTDPRLADIPVILVTSRGSDEDRERGMRLGADAYIVKSRFDQDDLLERIRRLL
ncbi:response regulator [Azospirillum sp. TSO22-1]|uniref:hybrid sensor histidine kinase/response regulator n=1 Tax=Azospirillum sp. TSO22-1 TaxID=716789 RepID=UPI000D604B32|nr:response regulator [Azospirillum sp. TSO22-1]PWC42337.1 histidine kinase [Azospirillum sp. TSO22-1]